VIFDLLENILTETQFWKMKRLLSDGGYPQLLDGKEVVARTTDISKRTGIRSDHVIRDLTQIGKICGRLIVEPIYFDESNRVIEDYFGLEEKKIRLGGKNKSRGVRLSWNMFEAKH
jgi:hypothetical protein